MRPSSTLVRWRWTILGSPCSFGRPRCCSSRALGGNQRGGSNEASSDQQRVCARNRNGRVRRLQQDARSQRAITTLCAVRGGATQDRRTPRRGTKGGGTEGGGTQGRGASPGGRAAQHSRRGAPLGR